MMQKRNELKRISYYFIISLDTPRTRHSSCSGHTALASDVQTRVCMRSSSWNALFVGWSTATCKCIRG